VATDLDRVTRSVTNTYQLMEICKEYECKLMLDGVHIDLDDPDDKFKLGIKALLADHEVDKTSVRTKDHLRTVAKHGHMVGNATLRYNKEIKRKTKKLVIDKKEATVITRIYKLYISGKSINEIEIFKDFCPAIIKEEMFEEVQSQRYRNKLNYSRSIIYLFMQKIKCPKCNSIMWTESKK